MNIPGAKIDQVKFKSKFCEIRKGDEKKKKSKEQKMQYAILKCFTK